MDRYSRFLEHGDDHTDDDDFGHDHERSFEEMACEFRFASDTEDQDHHHDTEDEHDWAHGTDTETEDDDQDEGRELRGGKSRMRSGRGRRGRGGVRFDLKPMQKMDDEYFQDGVGFNFCQFLPEAQYFASYSAQDGSGLQILTGDDPSPESRTLVMDGEHEIRGIKLTWMSNEPCVGGPTNSTNSFTAKVLCDEQNMIDGGADIVSVDKSDSCNPIVTLSHESGCPQMDDGRSLRFMRLLIPLFALLLVICLCAFMCCCCIRRRKANRERKERELKEGNTHMPIEAQQEPNNIN